MFEYFLWLQPVGLDLVASYKKGCRRGSGTSCSLLASTAAPLNHSCIVYFGLFMLLISIDCIVRIVVFTGCRQLLTSALQWPPPDASKSCCLLLYFCHIPSWNSTLTAVGTNQSRSPLLLSLQKLNNDTWGLSRSVRYIDMKYQLSIYRHF